MFMVQQIDHIALTVSDPERSKTWYGSVLGLEHRFAEVWGDEPLMLCAGETCLALFRSGSDRPAPPPDHHTISLRHVAFRADRANFERAREALRRHGIPFTFQDHQISHSIYLHDPDGYRIEITTYELGG